MRKRKVHVRIILLLVASSLAHFSSKGQALVTSAEAEDGVLTGVTVANQTGNSSGKFVTGFDNANDRVTVTVNVSKVGIYKLEIIYRSNQGTKTQDIYVNETLLGSTSFPQSSNFVPITVGNVLLNAGSNTLAVKSNWGFMDVDKFQLYSSLPHSYANTAPSLVDTKATAATKALYSFLRCQFGKSTISGQTKDYYEEIKKVAGKTPMLKAFDFKSYTQGYSYKWENGAHTFGAVDDKEAEAAIDWYNTTQKKGIVSIHWHWHSPTGGTAGTNTFYTNSTQFDVREAVKSGTPQHADILEDIDAIAVQLKKLQAANIPVVWRPLHEAGGAWFWWGAKGSAACKALYAILYDRLMNYHNLHNLIWTWSSPEADWYPGNDKVDIIGYDSYPGAFNYTVQKTMFDQLFEVVNGQKIIAMTENGPIPDIKTCFDSDAPWAYFMAWTDSYVVSNSTDHMKQVYGNPLTLSLENAGNCTVTSMEPEDLLDISSPACYPNPFHSTLQIKSDEQFTYQILDMTGKVYEEGSNIHTTEVGQSLPKGAYLLAVKTTSTDKYYRIIKN